MKGSVNMTEEKRKPGYPRKFDTGEAFLTKFVDYIEYCHDRRRFPNIAGFCAYCRMNRETFYKQEEYYSNAYNMIQDILEDEVLQHNTYMSQLYLKNKFKYSDKQDIKSENVGEVKVTLSEELSKYAD